MRLLSLAVAALAFGTFIVATAPAAEAVGYCVYKVKEPLPEDRCDGLVCIGYTSQGGWQTCVPPEIYCLQNPCCTYDPTSPDYACAPPRQVV